MAAQKMPRQSTVQPRTKRGVAVRRKLRNEELILADLRLHCKIHGLFAELKFILSLASHVENEV